MQPHIGVVIAGDRRHLARGAEMMQPFGGAHEFLRQAEIDEIAGHGDVVRLLLDDVAGDEVEDLAPMHVFPPAMPIDVAEHALAQQLAAPGARHRAQMDVGQMGEGEHGEGCACLMLSPDTKGPRLPCKCACSGVRGQPMPPDAEGCASPERLVDLRPEAGIAQGVALSIHFAVHVISDLARGGLAGAWPRRWRMEKTIGEDVFAWKPTWRMIW